MEGEGKENEAAERSASPHKIMQMFDHVKGWSDAYRVNWLELAGTSERLLAREQHKSQGGELEKGELQHSERKEEDG